MISRCRAKPIAASCGRPTHARIRAIDTASARALPGVIDILTGAQFAEDGLGAIPTFSVGSGWGGPDLILPGWPALATERVRHVGDPVAVIVANSLDLAKDPAELVEADYEVLPAVATVTAARAPGAPLLWDDAESNTAFRFELGDQAATEAAFARAAHTTTLTVANNRLIANPMEPRAAIGSYDEADGRYTLYSSTQTAHRARAQLARMIFGLPEHRFRVIAPDVGGGFGAKGSVHPEEVLVLWASGRIGRPVKWTADRSEALLADIQARDQVWRGEIALDDAARIIGGRFTAAFNLGAYTSNVAHVPPIVAAGAVTNAYAYGAVHVVVEGVYTNTPPTGPYCGAGQPEAEYLGERLIDQAAYELGLDAAELRRRNFIPASAMPYRTPLVRVLDTGEYEAVLDKTLERADRDGFATRRAESERRGRRRGMGLSYFVESSAYFNERLELRFDPGGTLTMIAGTHSHGQGHETIFRQMLAEWLGLEFDQIRFVQGDTDLVAFGRGTFASRSAAVAGSALRVASDEIIDKGRRIAAHVLEAAETDIEFAEGVYQVAGTDRRVDLIAVGRASFSHVGPLAGISTGLEAAGSFDHEAPSYPNGCHLCEVEVDPETGATELVRYCAVDDVGRVINPLILEGQVHGGVVQGIGQALMERVVFDEATAQVLSGSFMDYCMPRAKDLPSFELGSHEVPTPHNPLGAKGAGEGRTIGSTPAVICALLDALRPLGVTDLPLPASPHAIWRAIEDARKKAQE